MATKKTTKSESKPGVVKVAEKIAAIAGTVVGTKNRVVRKAGEAIDTAKAKLHDFTAAKKTVTKKAKKVVKKAAKKVKSATKKVAKKAVSKVATAKKKVKTATSKVKKAAKKAVRK